MERFSGADEIPLILDTLITFVIGVVLVCVLPSPWSWWLVGPAVVAVALAAGSRYRVTVDDAGVLVEWRRLWVVTVKRLRYRLDGWADLYDGLDFEAQGVCIQTLECPDMPPSECFGPARSPAKIEGLRDEIQASILRARARVEVLQRELGGPLASFADALELDERARGPGGRFVRGRTTAPIEIAGVCIPEGSTLELNDEHEWLDPRRDDALRCVVLSRPTWVSALGRDVVAGARLTFDDLLAYVRCVVGGLVGEVEVDGFCCDGTRALGFDADAKLRNFTLARSWTIPACTLPAGLYVRRRPPSGCDYSWSVGLDSPLSLPGVTLRRGDSLHLGEGGSLVSFYRSRGSIRVDSQELSCGVVAIPLSADGYIDLGACKQRGVPMKDC